LLSKTETELMRIQMLTPQLIFKLVFVNPSRQQLR